MTKPTLNFLKNICEFAAQHHLLVMVYLLHCLHVLFLTSPSDLVFIHKPNRPGGKSAAENAILSFYYGITSTLEYYLNTIEWNQTIADELNQLTNDANKYQICYPGGVVRSSINK